MRVVFDTNVIISAALTTHGACARILDVLLAGGYELCADDRILSEYESVLRRPELRIDAGDAATVTELVRHVALPVVGAPLPAELPDAGDLPFLEVAAAADAILVTGNRRHFPRKACRGVRVLSPREFLEVLRQLP